VSVVPRYPTIARDVNVVKYVRLFVTIYSIATRKQTLLERTRNQDVEKNPKLSDRGAQKFVETNKVPKCINTL